ncbi:MAG: hypothetical protein NT091_01035, partial [Candidatus Falkowbacteria bacterium]|nr:hypothetical protein [Candidatus Falkowbacteria bacterium]
MKEQIINPLLVIFADGWGVYQKYEGNIISKAITTNFNDFITHYPTTTIMPLNGEFSIDKKEALLTVNQVIQRGDKKGSKIHIIMPLLADISNIKEILSLCRKESFYRVYLHLIINSTYSKNETTNLILELNALLNKESFPAIATICGCFYALDQDNYYDRTNKAYETLVLGKGRISNDPIKLLNSGYLKKISNNEFEPSNIIKNGTISNGDCVLFFELTKNEIKQLKESLEQANFTKFKVTEPLKD